MHRNRMLQAQGNGYGPDAFAFEIFEVVSIMDDPHFNLETELTLLEHNYSQSDKDLNC